MLNLDTPRAYEIFYSSGTGKNVYKAIELF